MSKGRERELKFLYAGTRPPLLPAGWSLSTEQSPLALVDTYLDTYGALAARGCGLRKREDGSGNSVFTLKRDATAVGALHSREEIEAVAFNMADGSDAAAPPDEIRNLIDREFGREVTAGLRATITLTQQRSRWTLARHGVSVAKLTIDQVTAGSASWAELEIEFLSSLSDDDVTRFSRELHDALQNNPQLTISAESKGERARRLSL